MWNLNRTSPQHQQNFNNDPYNFWNRQQNNMRNSFGNNANASTNQSNNNSFNLPYKSYTKDEIITDEHGLQKYLRFAFKKENIFFKHLSIINT